MSKDRQESPPFVPPAGARPDPDRPRATYRFAKDLQAGDRIFVTHHHADNQFELVRTVASIISDTHKLTIIFEPYRNAAAELVGVDADQRFRVHQLAKK